VTPATASPPSLSVELAHRVESFELALEADPGADLAAHLPAPAHPLYLAALGELIRVDLEHAWGRGRRKRVADYAARFPAVLTNPVLLAGVAFEEYRQRLRAGDDVRPAEYELTFGIDAAGWGGFGPDSGDAPPADAPTTAVPVQAAPHATRAAAGPELHPTQPRRRAARARELSDAEAVSHWQEAAASLPEVGTEFAGFHLVEELGRGAFGRVYLARQGDLAGRLVALKVASGLGAESNTLAQLQHPNIVPIYSYHPAGPFQAVCMPYLGGTTLAQVVRQIGRNVPSSGRELRSTLTRARAETSVGHSSRGPAPDSAVAQPSSAAKPASGPAQEAAADETADGWARLEGLPFVDAVLALGGQLADGLAHAHRRGILHRDLKPANVLLTDEGRPLLLDFNLAEDTKLRGSAEGAMIGGTLPYMAPEHMAAFRRASGAIDARCDLYSLGVILFELLTGRHPFPVRKGSPRETVPLMIEDRAAPPPLRALNPAVPPSVEAVVRKCLAADPANRYQHAEDLREDIDRHLASRPLKFAPDSSRRERLLKWARRHPRLASSGTVAALAALLLFATVGGAVYARERTRSLEARGRFAEHQAAFRDAQLFLDDRTRSRHRLDEGLGRLRTVLAGYGASEGGDGWLSSPAVSYLPAAERERVRGDVGEAYFLMAQVALLKAAAATDGGARAEELARAAEWNELAGRHGAARLPRALREQRASLAELSGDRAAAERLRAEAELTPLESARDLFLAGGQQTRGGRHRGALKHLRRATQLDPTDPSAWFLRGNAHLALEQNELAVACFTACVSLRPDFAPAWMNRGLAYSRLRLAADARGDYDRAAELDPNSAEAYMQRAELREAAGDRDGAIEDYTRALATGAAPARAYFKRATARYHKKDFEGAKADRDAGFKAEPKDELSWVARAENRVKFGNDAKAALADIEEALKVNPWSVLALQNKAAILSECLREPAEAMKVLDRAVELHPDYVPARAGRGVLLARAGKRDLALRDAEESLRRDTRAPNLYQVGCIYALTARGNPEDRREAVRLLWAALKTGYGLDLVETDADLDALRPEKDFQAFVKEAKALFARRKD
jgi:serine/threonine protein kinase/Tfp pilus assembly protein PilF